MLLRLNLKKKHTREAYGSCTNVLLNENSTLSGHNEAVAMRSDLNFLMMKQHEHLDDQNNMRKRREHLLSMIKHSGHIDIRIDMKQDDGRQEPSPARLTVVWVVRTLLKCIVACDK